MNVRFFILSLLTVLNTKYEHKLNKHIICNQKIKGNDQLQSTNNRKRFNSKTCDFGQSFKRTEVTNFRFPLFLPNVFMRLFASLVHIDIVSFQKTLFESRVCKRTRSTYKWWGRDNQGLRFDYFFHQLILQQPQ